MPMEATAPSTDSNNVMFYMYASKTLLNRETVLLTAFVDYTVVISFHPCYWKNKMLLEWRSLYADEILMRVSAISGCALNGCSVGIISSASVC